MCVCPCVCFHVSDGVRGRGRQCLSSVAKVILILCVAGYRRGVPQAAGGPFQVLSGGG